MLNYLDNSATTPLDPKVLEAMLPFFTDKFANASSIHAAGGEANRAVESARKTVAGFLSCRPDEVIFTSGATESDNLAIFGLVRALHAADFVPHIIVSSIEHEAVLEPIKRLVRDGKATATYLAVDGQGLVDPEQVAAAITPETVLVSIMLASNEVGTIEPIEAIGQLIESANANRERRIYFHTDATQAPSYADCSVERLKVDLMSLSAHKIYGPKGIGALYMRKGTPLRPTNLGGGQERNLRSGTYNVPGIVGFARAIELISENREAEIKRIKGLRDSLVEKILAAVPDSYLTGSPTERLPSHASFIVPNVEGESMLLMLSQLGIMVSTGSACSSGSLDASHVLLAMKIPAEQAHGSLRVTLGRFTSENDVSALIEALPPIVAKLRQMSPLK